MMTTPAPYPSVETGAPIPDDAQIDRSLPSVNVDYLSHNWTDEDVWSSWKVMTKKKYEIANGVRLENASWRTWAKQRGKLKTVSPETLNWLKDSDVTWLYGPLHEHAEPVPPPKVASVSERFGLDLGHPSTLQSSPSLIPFQSQHQTGTTDGAAPEAYPPAKRPVDESGNPLSAGKAPFAHAGFGGYVNMSGKKSILKHRTIGDILAHPGELAGPNTEPVGSRDASDSEDSDSSQAGRKAYKDRASDSGSSEPTKRHITFNTRVEQCIALDPNDMADAASSSAEDDESATSSEEEGLTIKPSNHRVRRSSSATEISNSSSGAHTTIALLAPTRLKAYGPAARGAPEVVNPSGFVLDDEYGCGEPAARTWQLVDDEEEDEEYYPRSEDYYHEGSDEYMPAQGESMYDDDDVRDEADIDMLPPAPASSSTANSGPSCGAPPGEAEPRGRPSQRSPSTSEERMQDARRPGRRYNGSYAAAAAASLPCNYEGGTNLDYDGGSS